ncbi:Cysteine-rich membrane protein 1 [Spironucleus salmonicida]|uniref:Cysteine-rich membrane protein 1 n=2 Tax=Spironucleus salmonicida TaxID=348837 RepID=A0A9P8LKF8_9EUKA|nr:Cysteine-rich membrane protein 1 [Spironucleus salmonicida]
MAATGTCTRTDVTCKAGNFCPATDTASVSCIPCTADMKFGQGCYCEDNSVITNCKVCTGTSCSKCLPGAFLNNNFCDSCAKGCGECTAFSSCQKCADGFTMEGGTCVRICNTNDDCKDQGSTFCQISLKRCVKCGDKCDICSSATFCNACDGSTHITTIHGTCTVLCEGMADGNYCKDGVATVCAEGLDSACKCGFVQNCASCNTAKDACATCLPNVILGAGRTCTDCASGFKPIGNMCWPEQQGSGGNKIGTGAIVGIVVGVLVVVGAVGSGLAYYFIRKAKK